MEMLTEIYGGELPDDVTELYEEVQALFHKKSNGPLDLQLGCLIAVLAPKFQQPTKPTKKTEKAAV